MSIEIGNAAQLVAEAIWTLCVQYECVCVHERDEKKRSCEKLLEAVTHITLSTRRVPTSIRASPTCIHALEMRLYERLIQSLRSLTASHSELEPSLV